MVSENIDILFLVGYVAIGYLADWGINRYWFWYLDRASEGREVEGAIGRLAYRIMDKVWRVYVERVLIRPEEESTSEYRDLAEFTDTEAECGEATLSCLVTEILQKMFVWFSSVLFVGGIGGLFGILLASLFGHQEIFVWPGICLGAVVGGVLSLFILLNNSGSCSIHGGEAQQDSPSEMGHPEVNPAEVVGWGNYQSCEEIAWDLPDFG
jgi:hypothetical protein